MEEKENNVKIDKCETKLDANSSFKVHSCGNSNAKSQESNQVGELIGEIVNIQKGRKANIKIEIKFSD